MLPDIKTNEDLLTYISETDLEFATIGFVDYQGTVRGKYVSRDKLVSALDGMTLPLVTLFLDPTDAILEAPGSAENSGQSYADRPVHLLPETARLIPWERERRNLFLMAEYSPPFADFCPRNVYHRAYDYAQRLGFSAQHSVELEFTLFNETALSAAEKGYRGLNIATPHKTYYSLVRQGVQSGFYNDLMDMCAAMNIPLESLHEEMGDGFMEVALKYGTGVEMADRAALFRTFAKIVAQRQDKLVSFMARWSNACDGQSGHVHVSLTDAAGTPVFHDDADPNKMSDTMRHFIGGMQKLLPEFLLMCAPNINSFKRLVPGIFAPISTHWGIENRTCAIRAIPGAPKSSRVECRIPGADANPYLSLAALLAAGLYGVEHRITPTAPCEDITYDMDIPAEHAIPGSLREAIDRFSGSAVARQVFGDGFVDAYADTRRTQLAQFNATVTDAELGRFFELV